MTLPAGVEEQIVDALRDGRVSSFLIEPNGRTVSLVWWSTGPGSPQSGRTGIPLEDLLGAVLRRAARP